MEILKHVHANNLVAWAKDKPEVVLLSGDLTSSTEAHFFKEAYPDRFYSLGMAEQNMLSFAGGLAREGFVPLIHTFGVFIYRRAFDQLSMSVAYPNLRVRMFGFLPGITTPGGVTHQAIDDVAVLRGVPNMTILETGDATDVESVLDVAHAIDGPVYIRMIRGEIPRLFPQDDPMRFNTARTLSRGTDLTLFSSGICTEEAIRATSVLAERGVSIEHLHISTLKPFTDPAVIDAISKAQHGVITMENHTVINGLGSAVAEVMAEHGVGKRLLRIGLNDTYAHGGSRHYLMQHYGLDAIALVRAIEKHLDTTFDISEDDLANVHIEPIYSDARAEGL